jgi:broad-specificity NMP kinase
MKQLRRERDEATNEVERMGAQYNVIKQERDELRGKVDIDWSDWEQPGDAAVAQLQSIVRANIPHLVSTRERAAKLETHLDSLEKRHGSLEKQHGALASMHCRRCRDEETCRRDIKYAGARCIYFKERELK